MELSLYRKYRPQHFSDIVGQDHVVSTLKGALKFNKIAHAYLFAGPKATGKTSTARILAKAINCESNKEKPCNKCSSCLAITEGTAVDVIEIDAASSRGIDEIRDLREKIKFSPSLLKYKVFIIDEVHMLTREAFNALLKTLEEPPSHVVFMLITTEVHKIPQTIISRCQRFDFRKIKPTAIVKRLEYIAKKENIEYEKEALKIIAINAGGGLRDAISILDQAASMGQKVTIEVLKNLLGFTETKTIASFLDTILEKNSKKAIETINNLQENGIDLVYFCDNFINYLRNILIYKTVGNFNFIEVSEQEAKKIEKQSQIINQETLIFLIDIFLKAKKEIKEVTPPQFPLEMAIIKAIAKNEQKNYTEIKNKTINQNPKNEEDDNPKKKKINNLEKDQSNQEIKNSDNKNSNQITLEKIKEIWPKVVEKAKKCNGSLAIFLKAAEPVSFDGKQKIIVSFLYEYHKEKTLSGRNKIIVERLITDLLGTNIEIEGTTRQQINGQNNSNKEKNLIDEALEILEGKIIE